MRVASCLCSGLLLWASATIGAKGEAALDATVMFYSHGSMMTSGLPGTNHGIFYGCVYDGTEQLACFRDGFFIKNNRFIVFRLPAGSHTFSASYSGKHPAKNSQMPMQLEGGKTYFLRAQSESRGVIEIEWDRGRLDEVSCAVAAQEAATAKALKAERIPAKMAGLLAPAQVIPSCP